MFIYSFGSGAELAKSVMVKKVRKTFPLFSFSTFRYSDELLQKIVDVTVRQLANQDLTTRDVANIVYTTVKRVCGGRYDKDFEVEHAVLTVVWAAAIKSIESEIVEMYGGRLGQQLAEVPVAVAPTQVSSAAVSKADRGR